MEDRGCLGCSCCGCFSALLILGILLFLTLCGLITIGLFGYEVDWQHYLQSGFQFAALLSQTL
jgi:hypothetical protein